MPKGINPADFIMDCTSGVIRNLRDPSLTPDLLTLQWHNRHGHQTSLTCHQGTPNIYYLRRFQPSFVSQLQWCLQRNARQMLRSKRALFSGWLMFACAGILAGVLFADPRPKDIPLSAFMLLLALSVPAVTQSLRLFGSELLVMKRESWAGINMTSYFASKQIIALFDSLTSPFIFLAMYYGFAGPRGPVSIYVLLVWLTFAICQGLGMIISLTMQAGRSELFSIILTLTFMMLSGTRPTLNELRSGGVVAQALLGSSFGRYAAESLVIVEMKRLPEVFNTFRDVFLEKTGYNLNNFNHCITALVIISCKHCEA